MYTKSEALSHGTGICMQCGRDVDRILIGDSKPGGVREWRVVDWYEPRKCWLPHQCPKKPDPEPAARKAA